MFAKAFHSANEQLVVILNGTKWSEESSSESSLKRFFLRQNDTYAVL
ncbi:hypothetical protein ACFP3I_04015 [Chryseobacterium arachidis]